MGVDTNLVPMGWCLPGAEDHKNCRAEYSDWNNNVRTCICVCHNKVKGTHVKHKQTAQP